MNRVLPAARRSCTQHCFKTAEQWTSSNTVVGTLAVDGWAVTFGTARRGLGEAAQPAQAPPRCTKAHP